jgi:hypothetical protein
MAKRETPTVEGRDQWLQVLRRLSNLPAGRHTITLSTTGRLPEWWTVEPVQEVEREQQQPA